MKILSRYVFREFCVPLFYCLTGFVSIYLLFELFGSFSKLMAAQPTWSHVFTYLTGYLAPYFEWLAPACLMLATLYTMWQFCRHSEIIAMRASGIGFFAIVKPLLVGALLMAALVAWVNESYVPRHALWAKQFKTAKFHLDQMPLKGRLFYPNQMECRLWEAVDFTKEDGLYVLKDVHVVCRSKTPARTKNLEIIAPKAVYRDGVWYFELDPSLDRSRSSITYFDAQAHALDVPPSTSTNAPSAAELACFKQMRTHSFPQFTETPQDFRLAQRTSMLSFCSTKQRLKYLRLNPLLTHETRQGYLYDMWAQLLSPLACLVITLFAIPAGIATGRQSVFKGIVSALLLFFAFYAFTIGCMILAKKEWLAPLVAALAPHVIFFALGVRLFWKQR